MKTYRLLLIPLLATGSLAGSPPEPHYPRKILSFQNLTFIQKKQADLPSGIFYWINQGVESNADPTLVGGVAFIDINGDGVEEVIIKTSLKRDDQYDIWQNWNGRWIRIITISGACEFLARQNNYYRIATSYNYRRERTRELYEFKDGRYHVTRIDKYEDNTYVGTADTTANDGVLEYNLTEQTKSN